MSSCFGKGIFVFRNSAKNAGDYRKQVKASSPFGGRLAKNIRRQSRPLCSFSRTHAMFLRDSPVFAAF